MNHEHPKCIATFGCPVRGCDTDGECYLWRCENPKKRSPSGEGVPLAVRPAFAGALALAAFLFTGTFGYADALLMEAEEKEARVQRVIVHDIARKYVSIAVACANGRGFSMGDILVFCDPHPNPIAK